MKAVLLLQNVQKKPTFLPFQTNPKESFFLIYP